MSEPQEFHTHVMEAPSAPSPTTARRVPTVASTGGLPPIMPGPPPQQFTPQLPPRMPQVTERASDGSPHHIHVPEARQVGPVSSAPVGHREDDILKDSIPVEHRCGHIQSVKVWAEESRRKAQVAKIEKNGLCYSCSTGKK